MGPGHRRADRAAGRGLSDEELALWRHATRADRRLPGRGYEAADEPTPDTDTDTDSEAATKKRAAAPRTRPGGAAAAPPPAAGKAAGAKAAPPREAASGPDSALPPLEPGRAAGLDRRSAERLRRGRLPIDARLDLHGLTQAEAHVALNGFLADAQAAGKRCVLVITGKGGRARDDSGSEWSDAWAAGRLAGEGVLRQAVPRWLDQPPNRARVIAVHGAQPRHGGGGALYVLLRKARA